MLFTTFAFGQYISVDDIEKALENEMKSKSTDIKTMAKSIAEEIPLDKNGGFTCVSIVETPGKTKDQLYVMLNAWFLKVFDGKGIQMNDKDLGCIMAQERIYKITSNGKGFTSSNHNYEVDIMPTIRTDIKDGKIRITYNVPCYEVRDMTRALLVKNKSGKKSFSDTFPYNPKGPDKKMMARALVFTHYYSVLIVRDIENAVKEGVVGNEADDNW